MSLRKKIILRTLISTGMIFTAACGEKQKETKRDAAPPNVSLKRDAASPNVSLKLAGNDDAAAGTPLSTQASSTPAQPGRAWFGIEGQTLLTNGQEKIDVLIRVDNDIIIGDVDVKLNLFYTYMENLKITLKSPDGTSVILLSEEGGEYTDLKVIFDDEANTRKSVPATAESGFRYTLSQNLKLAAFDNKNARGDWIVEFTARYPTLDDGILRSMALGFTRQGDDHSNNPTDASPLISTLDTRTLLSESGRLEVLNDVDSFVFTAPKGGLAKFYVRGARNQFNYPSFVILDSNTGSSLGASVRVSASENSTTLSLVLGQR